MASLEELSSKTGPLADAIAWLQTGIKEDIIPQVKRKVDPPPERMIRAKEMRSMLMSLGTFVFLVTPRSIAGTALGGDPVRRLVDVVTAARQKGNARPSGPRRLPRHIRPQPPSGCLAWALVQLPLHKTTTMSGVRTVHVNDCCT